MVAIMSTTSLIHEFCGNIKLCLCSFQCNCLSFVPLRHQILAQMECNATNLNFALKPNKYLINFVSHLFGLQSV